ncbi:MAG: MBL fold metallo-hydrolase [Clostridiales Family XIII bacterium]|jgi:phosphoribosyl 1,2-cyclic phosphodiesterase|nr:MBL fold metallo-hydrolase [Clostridiales Family XIII bacterium]
MSLRYCSFSSGSSGNCHLIRSDETAILIDAGISASQIVSSLYRARTDTDEVTGILVTHEHSDHIKGLSAAANRMPQLRVWGSGGTFDAMQDAVSVDRQERFQPGEQFSIGDLDVRTFSTSHDAAEPIGYSVRHKGKIVSIVTDTGIFTEEILRETADADILVLESNHDIDLLKTGRYPQFLKSRILGDYGHLSNAQAANAIIDVMAMDRKMRCILLAHLSRDNNRPELAEQTVTEMLAEMDIYNGKDVFLKSLLRDRMSVVFEF